MRKYFLEIFVGLGMFVLPAFAQDFLLETLSETNIPAFHLTYTWNDFLMEDSCLSDFDQLKTLPFLSEEQRQLQTKMETYCVGKINAWKNLLTLFRQNKKALLINKTLTQNGPVMGYIKAVPYYLIDIHNTQPVGDDLFAKLDRIENAVQNKNPQQVVLLMQDLSANEQLFFMPLFNEVSNLIDFKKMLAESEV